MKKTILALLVLLFLLILTCVYQKTGVLYAKYNDHPQNTSPTIILKPLHMVKKLVEVKREDITKVAETAQEEIKITKCETEVVQTPVIKQKTSAVTLAAPSKQKDIEEIDTLMQALKNREIAFKNRDAFELYIQRLIKQALDNRTIAISHMNNEELHLIELQKELFEMQKELIRVRDRAYDKIGQTNIQTSGE